MLHIGGVGRDRQEGAVRGGGVTVNSFVQVRGPSNCLCQICNVSGDPTLTEVTNRNPHSHPVADTLWSPCTTESVHMGTEGKLLLNSGKMSPGSTSCYMSLALSSLYL